MFTKSQIISFRKEIEASLKDFAEKHNVTVKAGSTTFSDNEFKTTLEITKKQVGDLPYEQVVYEKHCKMVGLSPDDYMKKFAMNGKTFTIVGVNPRAYKMPIIAADDKGGRYKFSADTIKKLLIKTK